jgi:lipooligosaccharide transport system permease protein
VPTHSTLHFPQLSLRFIHVWRRNRLVWRKLAIPSMLGNLADPMLYMLGLGYGLGAMLPEVGGMPYITFLAAGTVCSSTMMSATFESMYSSFSRMHVQRTWDGIMNAPVSLDNVVMAEMLWAAYKAIFTVTAILLVMLALGISASPKLFVAWAVLALASITFSCIALIFNALAKGYDFFTYYFTLFMTPMMFLSGVFFPPGVRLAAAHAGGGAGAAHVPGPLAGRPGASPAGTVGLCRGGFLGGTGTDAQTLCRLSFT